jgi:hypothetical protein
VNKSPLIKPIYAKLFLIDTNSGQRIACHPHIVSKKLADLCLNVAREFALILKELSLVTNQSGILHILRGSYGYMVDKTLPSLPVIHIRTQYIENGYRAHSDDSRKINVIYSDYYETIFDSLIIPDTYATGRSVEAALLHMFKHGLSVERVIIYGFVAISAIERLYNLLVKHGIPLFVFAICDVTQLYTNNYDMPLYGLDEHLYRQQGILKPLGSIVSKDTLREMIPHYIPGMDQPGDWSERQNTLFNGHNNERGDIRGHLQRSIKLLESLDELNCQQPWYTDHIQSQTMKEVKKCKSLL